MRRPRASTLIKLLPVLKVFSVFFGKQSHYPLHGEKTRFRPDSEAAARPESIHRMQERLLVVVPTRNENDASTSSHSDSEPGRASDSQPRLSVPVCTVHCTRILKLKGPRRGVHRAAICPDSESESE